MTRPKKLSEVLNIRLDEAPAREIARMAAGQNRSESEVARQLLAYGIEVVRRLEAKEFSRPFSWQEHPEQEPFPGIIEIEARWREMTDEEIDAHGLREYVGYPIDDEDPEDGR